jgi:hypothetical protein
MSRVGVRKLLFWHRTRPDIDFNFRCVRWEHSSQLCVALYEDHYNINYQISNLSHIIDLTQFKNSIRFIYVKDEHQTHIDYMHGTWIIDFKYSRPSPQFYQALLQIPVTDIFTMFPVIVNAIQTL